MGVQRKCRGGEIKKEEALEESVCTCIYKNTPMRSCVTYRIAITTFPYVFF